MTTIERGFARQRVILCREGLEVNEHKLVVQGDDADCDGRIRPDGQAMKLISGEV